MLSAHLDDLGLIPGSHMADHGDDLNLFSDLYTHNVVCPTS